MKPLLAVLLLCQITVAETVVYKSMDGHFYSIVDSARGPSFERVTIVVIGDSPTTPTNPTKDKWGLVKVSRAAAKAVEPYADKDRHATTLSAYYTGLAKAVDDGLIPQSKLAMAVTEVFKTAVGTDINRWAAWKTATDNQFNESPINNQADAAQGLRDIGKGAGEAAEMQEIDFQNFLKFFIEVLLPLIIRLIGGGR